MAKTVHIKRASWAVIWDAAAGRHKYRRDADIVLADDRVVHAGAAYTGAADEVIDGAKLLAMPGLVNIHCHPRSQPIYKGIIEELGSPNFYMSGLYDVKAAFRGEERDAPASAELCYSELLQGGVTSVVDISSPYDGWIDIVAKSGVRGFLAPSFAQAQWYTDDGHQLKYRWDEAAGRRAFAMAIATMDQAEKHPCGRLSALVAPDTLDTCTVELMKDSIALAREKGRVFTIHCAESAVEFHELTRRFGQTPVQWAHAQGLIGPDTILGHVIFIDQHSWLHWWTRDDLRILAESGATVAHCPTPFARYGQTLENFGKYLRSGVRVGMGTDSFPHNLIEEMRLSLTLARVAAEDINAITTSEAFHAATVGGADALRRPDLGRIALGAKADLVLVDLEQMQMRPVRDPLRSLIYTAADRAVRDVFVEGRQVVAGGKVLTLDPTTAAARLEEAQRRCEERAPDKDHLRRSGLEISPLVLETMP